MKNKITFSLITILLFVFSIFYTYQLFLPGYQFFGEEKGFLNYDYVNYRYQTLWDAGHNFGSVSVSILNKIPLGIIWSFFGSLGLNNYQIQFCFFVIIIFSTLFFAYLLFEKITRAPLLSLILSFLYITTYNYYAIIATSPKLLQYLYMPAALWVWLSYIDTKKIRYLFLYVLITIATIGISVNLPQMISAYSFVCVFALIFSYKKATKKEFLVFFLIPTATLLYILFTFYLTLKHSGQVMPVDYFKLQWSATGSPVHEIVRFFGGWWDYGVSDGIAYNHHIYYYHATLGVIITYIPFTVLFLFLYKYRKQSTIAIPILIFILIFLTVTKGSTSPLRGVFYFLFKFPIVKIFREPWAKFIPNVILATYVSLALILQKENKLTSFLITILFTIIFVFQSYPIIAGSVIDHRNLKWRKLDAKVPDYWIDFSKWSKKNLQFSRTLVLPISMDPEKPVIHRWYPFYFLGKPEDFFAYTNILTNIYPHREDELALTTFLPSLSASSLSLAAVDYVLDKSDTYTSEKKVLDISKVKDGLDLDHEITFTDNYLHLYPVKKEYKTQKIRGIEKIQKVENICDMRHYNNVETVKSTAFVSNLAQVNEKKLYIPKNITFKQLTTSSFEIRIGDKIPAHSNVAILFTEGFNTGWNLYSKINLFPHTQINPITHIKTNCFSNLWVIDSSALSNKNTFYIHFIPHTFFKFATLFYGLILLIPFVLQFHKKKK